MIQKHPEPVSLHKQTVKTQVFGRSKYGNREALLKQEQRQRSNQAPKLEENGDDDCNSNDAEHKRTEDTFQTAQIKMELDEVKLEVEEENSDQDSNHPDGGENSSQNSNQGNSSQGENHDTDEPMSEEN